MNAQAQIARHLNVVESAIIEIQEWAKVLWVKVRGLGCRFVSKKVVNAAKTNEQIFKTLAKVESAKVWENHGKKRVYFDAASLLNLSKNQAKRRCYDKFYFDIENGFESKGLSDEEFQACKNIFQWAC